MNPAFDPFNPMAPRPSPGPGTNFTGTAGGYVPTEQFTNRVPTHMNESLRLAQTRDASVGDGSPAGPRPIPGPSVPNLNTGRAPTGGAPSPAPAPTGNWTPPSQYSRYFGGGNIGQSAPGSRSTTGAMPVDNVGEYPWMQDQSIQWGGGPFGYLPIGYVPQNFDYYSQGNYGGHLAPWEYKYMQDTFTQNYNPNDPGYINTANPAAMGRTRG